MVVFAVAPDLERLALQGLKAAAQCVLGEDFGFASSLIGVKRFVIHSTGNGFFS